MMDTKKPTTLPLIMLDPMIVQSDPAAYQFRLGAASTGEVASHAITDTEWNPLKHGAPLLVHQRTSGEYFVVDGHHRLAFAKRLAAEGKAPPHLAAYVLEESQGISVKDAKLMAAFADISRGKTNVGDAAAAIKEAGENDPALHKEKLMELPPIGNIPQAYKLASLSYGSLAKISGGEVPAEAASMVVDTVKDPEKRERVIGIISAKMKQDYPDWKPNAELATVLSGNANDNRKNFVDTLMRERSATRAQGLSV